MIDQTKMKNEMYGTLKDMGLQDELKKHLRVQIMEKLQQKNAIEKRQMREELHRRIIVSLIAEQLKSDDCDYAFSIYAAQAGYEDKLLSRKQLIQLLAFDTDEAKTSEESLLTLMICDNICFGKDSKKTQPIVRDQPQQKTLTIQQKLFMIDQEHRANFVNLKHNLQEAGIKKVRQIQELEDQYKRKYEKDTVRFKQFQAHKIKIRVGQQWRKKFETYATHLEDEYRRKMDHARKKHRIVDQELIARQNLLEDKMSSVMKTFKQKVQLLDMKNITIETQMKNINDNKKNLEEQQNRKIKQLADKTRNYDGLLLGLQKKIDFQVKVARLAMEKEHQQKQAQFLQRKKFIDQEYGKLMGIKDSTDIIQRQNERLFKENQSLRKQVSLLHQEIRDKITDIGNKSERLEYLKEEQRERKNENDKLKSKLSEEEKKRKKNESQILKMRQQLQNFRIINEEIERKEHQERQQLEKHQVNKKTSDLSLKLQKLRQIRKKQIEKFKLEA